MKKLYVFVIGMLLYVNVGFSQCPTGAMNFYSQADVDNFATNYPGCTSIGGIRIYYEVSNLNGLSQLTSVTGDVEIASWSNGVDVDYPLTDISGLYNLTSIGGSLHFYNVPNINASNLFPNLTHIGGHINFLAKTPATMSGFNGLQTLDGNFNVNTEFLSSLSGFGSLTRIGYPGSDYGAFSITDSILLTQVNGFGSLQYIRGLATITNNPLLQQLPNFSSLTQLGSQLAIQNNNSLQGVSQFGNLQTMAGTLILNSNAALQSISFPSLTTVNADLSIMSNPLLTSVNFPMLEQVSGTFNISGNAVLTNLGFTDADLTVGSSIHIYGNPQLSVCNKPVFCSAVNLGSVYDNAPGCNSVTQIRVSCGQPQNCYQVSLNSQQDVDNYPINYGCTSLEGGLYISGSDITNLNGLSQLTSVQSLSISSVPLLTNFSGLNQLTTISGNFDIQGSTAANMNMSLTSLQTIGGSFTINDISTINTLSGFTQLTSIGGNFQITNNPNLVSCTGFGSLQSISGFYDIYNNTSMTALPTTTALTHVDYYFRLTNNANTTLSGLNALTSIGYHFSLYDNPALTGISALSSLTTINGQLYIASNPQLVSLSGLDNLSTGVTNLTINSNPQLSACSMTSICSLIPVVSSYISNNARGCNTTTQVLVSCGQPQNCESIYLTSQQDIDNYAYNFGCSTVGQLYISGSDIVNLNGLSQITSAANLTLTNLPVLQNCSGLDNLQTLSGNLSIEGAMPTALSLLPNLASIGGHFTLSTHWSLPPSTLASLQGFTNLVSIGGNFEIYNMSLTQLPTFPNLTSVGSISISSNPQLTNLNALSHLTTVNGNITISSNNALNNIYGLNQMATAGITSLYIHNNPQLSLCNATSVCNYIAGSQYAYISDNAAGCFSIAEVESSCTNQLPIFGYISAPVYFCAGSSTTVNMAGLFPYSVSTVGYRIGNGQVQTATNVLADIYGSASFQIVFTAQNEGETLAITSITRSDVSGETLNVTQNNTALLIRYPESTYYRDADADGYGNIAVSVLACSPPTGFVSDQNDCDDTDNTKFVLRTFYQDSDDDGYGTVNPTTFCTDYATIPSGFVTNNSDCNDNNAAVYQPSTFYVDADHDGFGSSTTALLCELSPPTGYSPVSGDCNDASASINPVAQRLEFSSSPNFSTSICAPLTGTVYTPFSFEAVYYDANNALPSASFPRVYLDYEGNGVLNDSADRVVVMTPYDVNDLDIADGKRYIATINNLPYGANWQTRVQISNSGCLTTFGPFNYPDVLIDPDLQIFANDISLSSNHPAVSSPLTVSAVMRNASDYPTQSFYAHLVNQYDTNIVYGDVLVSGLAPHASTTVSWNITTPAEPAWCPMQVVIDYTNVISETNEFNNSAVRPFINGNYNLLGGIDVISETVSPEVSYAAPDTYVAVSGSGRYYDVLRALPDDIVSGATVNVRIVETGRTGFGYTNAHGDFFCSIPAPEIPGIYHIEGEMTDFTFTGYFNLTFEKITPVVSCITDLSIDVAATSASTIIEGQSVSGRLTVMNNCAAISSPTLLHFSQDSGSPQISDVMVPALDPYGSFTTSFSNIVFNTPGTYSICATVDAEFSISEANENNNTHCMLVGVLPNLPDIYAGAGPVRTTCQDSHNESFLVGNLGGVASGPFNCEILVKKDEAVVGTYYHTVAGVEAGVTLSFTELISYPSPGDYTFELRCDYDNQLEETNESNNTGYFGTVTLREPEPDLGLIYVPGISEYLCEAGNGINIPMVNSGCTATGVFNCDILVKRDGILLETWHETIAGIDAESYYTLTKPFVYTAVGHYTFEVHCDVTNAVTETDEDNNTLVYSKYIAACKPNLAFDSGCEVFDVQPVDPQHPGTVTYTATILNNGNATANGPIGVRFKITEELYYDMTSNDNLVPGASAVVTVTVPSVAPATQSLEVMVDHGGLIDEFNENDNQIEGELCWDFQPVDRPPLCGDDFWKYSYVKHQEVPISVALNQYHLYDASSVQVKFEVSGPGLEGLVDLGTVTVNNIQQNCACPYVAALPDTFVVPDTGTYTFVMTVDPNHVYTECSESNNVLIRSIQATTLPDLRVLSQYINPSLLNPDPGEPIQLDLTYENIGNPNITDNMQFKVFVDADLFYTTTVSGLPSGQNQTIHLPVSWSSNVVGTHIIRTVIDSGNTVVESDELNNTATRAIIVGEASNLYFQSFATANYSPALNAGILLNTVIGNNGDLLCQADLQFYYINDAFQEIAIGTQHISVGANSSITIQMPWTVADNDTTIYARIINPSTLEFNDEDNLASLMIGKTDVSLKLFVEGYYGGAGTMASVKSNQGAANASAEAVETLTVALFDAVTLQPAGTTTALLHTDGSLDCRFSPPVKGNYYIAVKGGNVLQTWSALPKKLGSEPLYYDFSGAASQAYGNNMQQMEPGVFALYSGDINQDDYIEFTDYTIWETDSNEFASGEYNTDLNGDGFVEYTDYTIWEKNANNFTSAFYPQ